jgi:hypothetical protein
LRDRIISSDIKLGGRSFSGYIFSLLDVMNAACTHFLFILGVNFCQLLIKQQLINVFNQQLLFFGHDFEMVEVFAF